jgi:hypothetical protein
MLDVGQTPESIAVLMKQGIVWFNSMNTFWRTKRFVANLRLPNYCRATTRMMMLRLIHTNLAWALYPLLYTAATAWVIVQREWLLLAYAALAWAIYLGPVVMILRRFDLWTRLCAPFEPIREPSWRSKTALTLMYGIEKIGACVSPWLWAFYVVRRWMGGVPLTLQKTERA